MIVHKVHLDAFARAQEEDFEDRLVAFLRRQFPDASEMPERDFRVGVRAQMLRAAGYGMDAEQDIAVYCTVGWLLGEDFPEEFPAAGAALVNPEFSSHLKAEWLGNWVDKLFSALEDRG